MTLRAGCHVNAVDYAEGAGITSTREGARGSEVSGDVVVGSGYLDPGRAPAGGGIG
ncbi:hypothetical protein BN12_310002 [Nostocoides japonicum T1-X7]|uniref:Uncharacterized protein n=1 Tax=Nostocoides japonicum T1-X7 TaxID=1194083 RepID=A0A077M346_9MICO|nr:hypothetical protein BN12_310002 [Tetrasphaera japonica T1-X7]